MSNSEDSIDHIVFSSDDQRLKMLGEIFGNNTSRKIITILIDNEMTATQISEDLEIKLNLVMYHLEKMLALQIISITKKTKNTRGHIMKHYRAKQAVMIFSKHAKKKAEKSKMLSDIIKRVTKFSAIGITGAFTWIISNSVQNMNALDTALKYPRPTLPYMTTITPQSGSDVTIPILLSVAVIASLLVLDKKLFPKLRLKLKSYLPMGNS